MAVGEELVSRPEQRAAQETGEVMNGFGRYVGAEMCIERLVFQQYGMRGVCANTARCRNVCA